MHRQCKEVAQIDQSLDGFGSVLIVFIWTVRCPNKIIWVIVSARDFRLADMGYLLGQTLGWKMQRSFGQFSC